MGKSYLIFPPIGRESQAPKDVRHSRPDVSLFVSDKRVSRLLGVLQELDQCVEGLEYLPHHDLVNLITSAIHGCGFAGPEDARYAIAAVLRAIEATDASEWS